MKESTLQKALNYQHAGYNVIPVRKDKKPFVKWTKHQAKKETYQKYNKIRRWWKEFGLGTNVAIVTGKVSNLVVVDVDSQAGLDALNEFLPDSLITPTAKTPKGWHYYFKYDEEIKTGTRIITDTDIRADGAYIIAPPSSNGDGKHYSWMDGLSILEVDPAPLPEMLFDILKSGGARPADSSPQYKNGIDPSNKKVLTRGAQHSQPQQGITNRNKRSITFYEPGRDESLFHIANCLNRGGMERDNILKCLLFMGSKCNPPFPEKEIRVKIDSAFKRAENQKRNLTSEVREWVSATWGNITATEALQNITNATFEDRKKIRVILGRLVDKGTLERVPNKNGCYRRVDTEAEAMDFMSAETETVNIWLPFALSEKVELMPGNIVVVAGSPDSGKTGLLLNIIRENMRQHEVHYFNSEMGSSELKKRLSNFDDITLDMWNFKAWERSDNFGDVIKPGPGKINIIDFLEMHDNFYEVGGKLAEIHKKLKGAIAFVALQKNPGQKMGLGGFRSAEKPRLYLSMDSGALTIAKAKNWATSENPNGLQYRFKIVGGCKFIKVQGWHTPV